jgi:hypothetical protein
METITNIENQNLNQVTPQPSKNPYKILFFVFLGLFLVTVLTSIYLFLKNNKINQNNQNTTISTIKTPTSLKENSNLLKISDIKMDLPDGWKVISVNENKAKILTDYKQYQVSVNLVLGKNDQDAKETYESVKSNSVKTQYGEVYNIACGGPNGCTGAFINGNLYSFIWTIESNQPYPADLDGIWVPDNNLTGQTFLNITKTVRPSETPNQSYDWRTYNDSNYKYSIDYPDSWNFKQVSNNQICLFSDSINKTLCNISIIVNPFIEYFANYNDHVSTSSFDELAIQGVESEYGNDSYEKLDINGNTGYIIKISNLYKVLFNADNYVYEITFEDLLKPNQVDTQVLETFKLH